LARSRTPAPPANTSTAIVVASPREAIQTIDGYIVDRASELIPLLGSPDELDRLRSLTAHALADPKLAAKLVKADLATVYLAVRECASLGLMPIPSLAEAYFVPYWNRDKGRYDVQMQPGWQGLAKLVRNSGRVVDVGAGVAYSGDVFDYDEGSSAFVRHKRALRDRGERIAAYAIAWLPGGVVRARVMDMAEIELHRQASKATDGPWIDWYDAMATKTVLRDLCKQLPKSAKVEQALMLENDAEDRYSRTPRTAATAPDRLAGIHARLGMPTADGEPSAEPDQAANPAEAEPDREPVSASDSPDVVAEVLELFEGEVVGVTDEEPGETPSNAGVHI
jgi:recombination protein RecT